MERQESRDETVPSFETAEERMDYFINLDKLCSLSVEDTSRLISARREATEAMGGGVGEVLRRFSRRYRWRLQQGLVKFDH
jgi:hypothetical protein